MQKFLTKDKKRRTLESLMADMTLGGFLKMLRGDRSLRAVAVECGISHSLLAQIENDEVRLPRRDTMVALSRFYGVPLEALARFAYCGGQPAEVEPVPA